MTLKSRLVIADNSKDAFCLFACTQPYSPLINGFVDDATRDALLQSVKCCSKSLMSYLVHMIFHRYPNMVVNWFQVDCLVATDLANGLTTELHRCSMFTPNQAVIG